MFAKFWKYENFHIGCRASKKCNPSIKVKKLKANPSKAYPNAQIIGPDALPEARDKQNYFKLPSSLWTLFKPAGKADADPASTHWRVSDEFDREFDREYIHAHMNKELVFNHRPSGTLIEADLLFNLPATEQYSRAGPGEKATDGILTKIFAALQHTRGNALGQRRFLWYAGSASDRPAFNASVRRIQGWSFDRIIPCHGDVIETGGKGIFEKIMQWHLEAKPKST